MSSVSRDNHDNEDWLNGNNNLLSKERKSPGKWNRSSSTDSGSMKSSGSGKMGRRGSNRQRAITIRRQSVHQDMTEHASISVRNIRRQFYGLEVDDKVIDKAKNFFEHWRDTFTATVIVFLYFLIGLIFYKNVEGWDSLTCIYFQVVTMTTVGYGDFSPTTTGSRIFTILFIITGIVIVGRIVNDFAEYVVEYAEKKAELRDTKRKKREEVAKKNNERLLKESQLHVQGPQEYTTSSLRTTTTDTKDSFKSPSQPYYAHATKLSDYSTKIVFSLGSIFLCLFIGAVFYHINEGWDFTMAFYFCVVTMCTVGYGDTHSPSPAPVPLRYSSS